MWELLLYFVVGIGSLIAASFIVKYFRRFVTEKKLEQPCDTLKNVDVKNVCVFCGKPLFHNAGWKQKMHREIRCESTIRGQERTFENIEINIPCCQECADSNRIAEKKADQKAMLVSSCISAVGTLCLFFWMWQCGDLKDRWFGAFFIMFFVWGLLYVLVRWLFMPLFEKQIIDCSIIEALMKKDWRLGESPGVKKDK